MHHIQIRNCLQIGLVPAIQVSICSIPHSNTLCVLYPIYGRHYDLHSIIKSRTVLDSTYENKSFKRKRSSTHFQSGIFEIISVQ